MLRLRLCFARTISHRSNLRSGPFQSDWNPSWLQAPATQISRDISKGEAVEADLDAFITRRHDYRVAKEGHRPSEEMYEESTRRYQEQMRAAARVEWHLHHVSQAERLRRTLEALVEYHDEQAANLMDVQPEGAA